VTRLRPDQLRSHRWFGVDDLRGFGHRSRAKQAGFGPEDYAGKPVVAILNTWSDLNPCHLHFRLRADEVKRGVWQAGGFPLEIPVLALPEIVMKPTTMLYRNLLAMEVEEVLRSQPFDAAVLMGGCDKTTPGLLMGAFSVDLPCLFLPAGPMLKGNWRGATLGSGSSVWKHWDERRAGALAQASWDEIEDGIARSAGHCMTMGTASTMTALVETMGLALPGASSIPAVDARHGRMAAATGRAVVDMAWGDRRPSGIVERRHFLNALVALAALGGSTNAIIHLLALAGRLGVALDLDDVDRVARAVPVLADVQPAGRFLMEDFFLAGGLRALLARVADHLDLDAPTAAGATLGDGLAGAACHDDEVIRPLARPLAPEGGIAVLRGNLAPSGSVIKHTAASPGLLRHRGPAVVFDGVHDLERRIDDPDLDVTADSVLVLRGAGPLGGPGMPEWGMLPIPKGLLAQGVRDMVRVSDARMSGTSYGTCVLHVAPEAHVGGPLALVHDGDLIELDVPGRRLTLHVDDATIAARRAAWRPPPAPYARGYGALFARHVTQADKGCDFDVLAHGPATPEPTIH
jgi:dihydroxy-acid dehydratase